MGIDLIDVNEIFQVKGKSTGDYYYRASKNSATGKHLIAVIGDFHGALVEFGLSYDGKFLPLPCNVNNPPDSGNYFQDTAIIGCGADLIIKINVKDVSPDITVITRSYM